MKPTSLTKAIEEVVALKSQAIDRVLQDLVEPLAKIGRPEELIGKKYEQWTPQDLLMLGKIYGPQDGTPLSNLIFKKTYERVKALEAEEMT